METRTLKTQVPAVLAERLESMSRQLGMDADSILADALQEWMTRNAVSDMMPAIAAAYAPISIGRHRAIDWAESF